MPRRPTTRPNREHGIALVLFTVGTLAIVAVAGLALDLGLAYLARARLQNALDAAALSGAKTLNKTFDEDLAEEAAQATYVLNRGGLSDTITPLVEMSPTLSPFDPAGLSPRFVRVSVAAMPSPLRFASVLPGLGSAIDISGAAVAGPIPLGLIRRALPIALCDKDTTPPVDDDCGDNACFGYGPGDFTIKSHDASLGPGNYGFVTLDCRGAACLREGMAGAGNFSFEDGGTIVTEPGSSPMPAAQGLNTRFNIYLGPVSPEDYPCDVVITPGLTYAEYQARLGNEANWNCVPGPGVPQRRVAVVPVVECDPPINGRRTVDVIGKMCLYLKFPADPITGEMVGEIAESCEADGEVPEAPGESSVYKIVLYQNVPGA